VDGRDQHRVQQRVPARQGSRASRTLVRLSVPGLNLTRRLHAIWPAGHTLQGTASAVG
jgi:hypothetical protein